jgi:cation transport protein ChaC
MRNETPPSQPSGISVAAAPVPAGAASDPPLHRSRRRVRQLALTPELVARTRRPVEDPGPDPDLVYHTDADYAAAVRKTLAERPPGDLWLFAYGSLIWKPCVDVDEKRIGTVRGWHRAFCLRMRRFRATKEQPGLMLALDRGGQCRGVVFRLREATLEQSLEKLFRREMSVKPPNNMPRWLKVDTPAGSLRALGFVMNRTARYYAGRLPNQEVAELLATACGHWGSCAEYLYNTVTHLEEHGIHDRHLWELQRLVAERIAAAAQS